MELVPQLNDFSYDGIACLIEHCVQFKSKADVLFGLGAAAAYAQLASRLGLISCCEEQKLLLCIQRYL